MIVKNVYLINVMYNFLINEYHFFYILNCQRDQIFAGLKMKIENSLKFISFNCIWTPSGFFESKNLLLLSFL